MKCIDCGNEHNGKYNLCVNCYFRLKNQFIEEAKKEMKKYNVDNQDTWSSIYNYAVTDLLTYGDDDFGSEPQKTSDERLFYYFSKRYVKAKISEYCKSLKQKNIIRQK